MIKTPRKLYTTPTAAMMFGSLCLSGSPVFASEWKNAPDIPLKTKVIIFAIEIVLLAIVLFVVRFTSGNNEQNEQENKDGKGSEHKDDDNTKKRQE